MRKVLGLQTASGTAAYSFSPQDPRALKTTLKSFFDDVLEADLTQEEVAAIIAEHQKVFDFNHDIISGYKVGFWAPIAGATKLMLKSKVAVGVVAAMLTGVVAVVLARKYM